MIRPACVPPSVKEVKYPRRWSGACSRLSEFAPDCSPEAEKPCSSLQADEQDRRPDADRVVAWQAADEEGRRAHQRDGEDQDALAAVLVADVAHEERADGPGDIADAVGGERQQRAGRGVGLGEEDLAEDERGGSAVDEEVVVLEDAADPACQRRLARGLARLVAVVAPASCSRRRLLPADVMYGLVRYVRRRGL
jgi:hypothetical protein